jgi:replicative DNA helicase
MLTIADACTAFAPPDWIEDKARACKAEGNRLLIVLDSLHAWTDAGNNSNALFYEAVNTAIASLHALAARLEAPILVLAERNRASQEKGGVNSVANSGRIEYRAETVWGLERSAPDAYKNYTITLSLDKNRHGAQGQIELQFTGALQQFTEA